MRREDVRVPPAASQVRRVPRQHPRGEKRIAEVARDVVGDPGYERPGHGDRQGDVDEEDRGRGARRHHELPTWADVSSRFALCAHLGQRDYSDCMTRAFIALSAALTIASMPASA